jgi:hypothetical protein
MSQAPILPEDDDEKQLEAAFAELTAAIGEFEEAVHAGNAALLAQARPRLEAAAHNITADAEFLRRLKVLYGI